VTIEEGPMCKCRNKPSELPRLHGENSFPILPVSLLLTGKSCLVVGGGPVAARKIGQLLEAKADVTVVCLSATQELLKFARAKRIHLAMRAFQKSDVRGMHLVFAATNSETVNRQVIASCRRLGILCSAADANWPDGDFVMPAMCRKNGLVVSVSTGGRSCRQARDVKDQIARMLTAFETKAGGAPVSDPANVQMDRRMRRSMPPAPQ